ncbi:MAG: class A beta-lactamase-related serine hydrolase [Promethearchaeota archaeon]|nr:MAG: class A beta-lactamase-related serine hydrolase [Candidatus Lokiarchaeota archaeon]
MDDKFKSLGKIIRTYMRRHRIPGLSISIIQEDKMIYSKGFGARDLEEFLPMTPQTLIGIGSITKSITAFGIMKLVETGKLDLEDSASKYLDFAPFTSHPDMTIKHMLSHTTGVPAADAGLSSLFYLFDDYSRVFPATNYEDFIAHIGDPEDYIIFEPGEKFFYNNDMYTCLGFIISQVSGQEYVDFIRKEILEPLEMKRAFFSKDNFNNDPLNNKITGYLTEKKGNILVPKKNPVPLYEYLNAPGGLYVSTEEMINYILCLLQNGVYHGKELLTNKSIKELWTPIIACPYGFGENPHYCLGWVKSNNYLSTKIMHHGGGLGTSCAHIALDLDHKIGIMAGQNSCNANINVIIKAALSILLGFDPTKEVEELNLETIIDDIKGNYKSPHDLYDLKISLDKGILTADIEIDDGPMSYPIIVENLDTLDFKICGTLPPIKQNIRFIKSPKSNKVEFAIFDRYLYRKT